MKVFTNYLLGVLVLGIMLQSCKKEDSSGAYPSGQGKFTATGDLSIDLTGSLSTFRRITTATYDSIYVGGTTSTAIVGLSFVNVKTTPATLPLNTQTALAAYITGSIASPIYYLSTLSTSAGTATITALSSTAIEGTYSTTVKRFGGDDSLKFSGTFKGSF
ncbi:MAG: hypothetical protein QM541_13805 [Flavobacterium sp.]|nr:hypothetical protein [Flavobacterium sp.]